MTVKLAQLPALLSLLSLLSAIGHQSSLSKKKQETQPSYHLITVFQCNVEYVMCQAWRPLANQGSRFVCASDAMVLMARCDGSASLRCW